MSLRILSLLLLASAADAALSGASILYTDETNNKVGVLVTSDSPIAAGQTFKITTTAATFTWYDTALAAVIYSRAANTGSVQKDTITAVKDTVNSSIARLMTGKSIGDNYFTTNNAQILLEMPLTFVATGGAITVELETVNTVNTAAYNSSLECTCGTGNNANNALSVNMSCKSAFVKNNHEVKLFMLHDGDVTFNKTNLQTARTSNQLLTKVNGAATPGTVGIEADGIYAELKMQSTTDINANTSFLVEFGAAANQNISSNFEIKCGADIFCSTTADQFSVGKVTLCSSASKMALTFVPFLSVLASLM